MKIICRILIVVSSIVATSVIHAATDAPIIVPVEQEPRHRLVFEKDDIRIINVNVPPGDTSLYHTHSDPTVYVVFSGVLLRAQTLGKQWTTLRPEQIRRVGEIAYREDYLTKPLTHRVENIDDESFRVLGIINSGAGAKARIVTATHTVTKPELDNNWFRGYRFKLEAGNTTDMHRHDYPVVVVQINKANTDVFEKDRPTAEKTVAGNWSWHRAGVGHKLRNIGEVAVELVEIEVK